MTKFEDILLDIGQVGWYQFTLVLVITLGWEMVTAWSMLNLVFVGADPGWSCRDELAGNITISKDIFGQSSASSVSLGATQVAPLNWTSPNATTIGCGECTSYLFNQDFTSIVTEWELVCSRDFISDTISSLLMAGVLIGCVVFGQLSDLFGRKKAFFVAVLLTSSTGLGQAFTTSWIQFAGLRFANGVGCGGGLVAGYIYGIEFLGPKYRQMTVAFGVWSISAIVLVGFAYAIRDWRHLMIVTSTPGFIVIFLWWFLPESPRWLFSQGRYEEVTAIVKRIAKFNKKPQPNMEKFIKEYEKEKEIQSHSEKYGFWDLFRTPTLTKRTAMIMYVWFSMSLFNYGATFHLKNLPGDRYVNYLINFAVRYLSPFSMFFLPRWLGRKTIAVVALFFATVCIVPIMTIFLLGLFDELAIVATILITLATTSVGIGWLAMYVLTSESYPTHIRNVGLGVASMSARAAGILAPQLAYFSKFWGAVPFVISGFFALTAGIITCFQHETKGKALPETVPDREWCFCLGRNKIDDNKYKDEDGVWVTRL
ncbi:organic cation transporter protein [Lingula anatina]|uniref:Organic cation transporter protein n=1 Tax=Lingula anatina TaxID=7574 RepID=A0A1S3KF16_LINAN|nr:organic cation transporter protein [Lingula anatina]|eukprot:XP_013421077.1 organic cation transporter protein [Lingula anatina]